MSLWFLGEGDRWRKWVSCRSAGHASGVHDAHWSGAFDFLLVQFVHLSREWVGVMWPWRVVQPARGTRFCALGKLGQSGPWGLIFAWWSVLALFRGLRDFIMIIPDLFGYVSFWIIFIANNWYQSLRLRKFQVDFFEEYVNNKALYWQVWYLHQFWVVPTEYECNLDSKWCSQAPFMARLRSLLLDYW